MSLAQVVVRNLHDDAFLQKGVGGRRRETDNSTPRPIFPHPITPNAAAVGGGDVVMHFVYDETCGGRIVAFGNIG